MTTRPVPSRTHRSGSVLLVTVVIAGILAMVVGTYLALTVQGNGIVKRSTGWNAALPMAEAGVEEALTHVIKNTNGFGVDGWTFNPTNVAYCKKRYLSDGYYNVGIAGAQGGTVTITSVGYGAWKGSNYIARTVQVVADTPFPFVPIGLEATNITFGGTFRADSFDSSDPLHSTNGAYDRTKATAKVTIATPGTGFRLAGDSQIRGYAATGPGGSVRIGGAALVGDENFVGPGIQAGHQTNNYAATYPTILAPFTSTTPGVQVPTNGTVAGTTYTYLLTGGKYFTTNLDSASYGKTLYVASNATLYVTGNIDLSTVVFATNYTGVTNNGLTGPRLDLYIGGASVTFTPTVVDGRPPQFWVWGLPSCNTISLAAQKTYTGVIYAPQVNLRGNGSATLCGAIVAATFSCLGNFDFHYDLSTRPRDPRPFKILSWAEL